jgi:hypothetical protein
MSRVAQWRRSLGEVSESITELQASPLDGLAEVCIPELPEGRRLTLSLLSTWGDPHFVGLAALEIFDSAGEKISIEDVARQVYADPPDINILPECAPWPLASQ